MEVAIILGVTGQDGSYLAELLLKKDYYVVGTKRRTSLLNTDRIDHIYNHPNFVLEYYDLNDTGKIYNLLNKYKPSELYNLAAQSHVKVSFDISEHTVDGISMGTLRVLNAIKEVSPYTKMYQASSSEMFGDSSDVPLEGFNENSKFAPASPYACAKVFAHNLVRNYREAYGLRCCSGVLFNHGSPRRGETFVTRKITMGAAAIAVGKQEKIVLGNLDAYRDWGHAEDYVEAMWLMLQQKEFDDYVISTGKTHSVRDFLKIVFEHAGLGNYEDYVEIDPKYFRPHEVPYLLGDSSKARQKLGWQPKKTFEELAKEMYDFDYLLHEQKK